MAELSQQQLEELRESAKLEVALRNEALGHILFAARRVLRLTLEECAAEIGCQAETYANMEYGLTPISAAQYERLVKLLAIPAYVAWPLEMMPDSPSNIQYIQLPSATVGDNTEDEAELGRAINQGMVIVIGPYPASALPNAFRNIYRDGKHTGWHLRRVLWQTTDVSDESGKQIEKYMGDSFPIAKDVSERFEKRREARRKAREGRLVRKRNKRLEKT